MHTLDLLAITASVIIALFVVEAIRRTRLNARYAIVWLGASAVLLIFSLYRPLLHWAAHALGIAYPPSLLFGLAFLFSLIILLHYSLVISSHRDSIRRLAQTVALLERALEEERAHARRASS
ncbi:MAG: DUF2304 domain-containing protein [Candidatus Binatia bacterium]